MSAADELQNALLEIKSRLGTIEGKINMIARVEREALLGVLEAAVRKDPLIGQVYLSLDGSRTQLDVIDHLATYAIKPSQPTVSRRMRDLVQEYGIADPLEARGVLRKNRAAEDVLNLSTRIASWLESMGAAVPVPPRRRPKKG